MSEYGDREVRGPARAVWVQLRCKPCGVAPGLMVSTGQVVTQQHGGGVNIEHKCDRCGATEWLDRAYPHVVWESAEERWVGCYHE